MRKKYRLWVSGLLSLTITILLCIGAFNYIIDPLWIFNHKHKFNDVQGDYNERQQKSNLIAYTDFDYDSLLLGSSRSTYINQNDFVDLQLFNYAVSAVTIEELNSFIEFAKEQKGSEFENIVIGLDFFGTNSKYLSPKDPSEYLNNTNDLLYKYKSLLSVDTIEYSLKNLKASFKDNRSLSKRTYDRNNVAYANKFTEKQTEKMFSHEEKKYRDVIYGDYEYKEDYRDLLQSIKNNNPNTNFIIFTTPESETLYNIMINKGLYADYSRWLKEIVSVFGGVHNFMYPNTITADLDNYYDGHHFYPSVGTLIAHKIINYPDKNIPDDFGILLNKDNLTSYLDNNGTIVTALK